ncbi:MAG: hypothetical protein VX700_00310 [Pseudomonadota bacterium]|nr:hypothetical protein [Pseudomonadota bacterium]
MLMIRPSLVPQCNIRSPEIMLLASAYYFPGRLFSSVGKIGCGKVCGYKLPGVPLINNPETLYGFGA